MLILYSCSCIQAGHRDERDLQRAAVASANAASAAAAEVQRLNRMSGEEEWKNIHTMLNCISAMVDKTKRAITILQQRGVDNQPNYPNEPSAVAVAEIRRQTEEKVSEFKRNAEDAVNQVGVFLLLIFLFARANEIGFLTGQTTSRYRDTKSSGYCRE